MWKLVFGHTISPSTKIIKWQRCTATFRSAIKSSFLVKTYWTHTHTQTKWPNILCSALPLSLSSSNKRNKCKTAVEFHHFCLHTQMKLDFVVWQRRLWRRRRPTILCNQREFCQRSSWLVAVSFDCYHNFAFVRAFICFRVFTSKQKTMLHPFGIYTMAKLLKLRFTQNKWMCGTFITNYEMQIFTNLWFNMN